MDEAREFGEFGGNCGQLESRHGPADTTAGALRERWS